MAYVMSIVFCLMSIGSMSHVGFKKQPCRPVELKGQGPKNEASLEHMVIVAWRGGRVDISPAAGHNSSDPGMEWVAR